MSRVTLTRRRVAMGTADEVRTYHRGSRRSRCTAPASSALTVPVSHFPSRAAASLQQSVLGASGAGSGPCRAHVPPPRMATWFRSRRARHLRPLFRRASHRHQIPGQENLRSAASFSLISPCAVSRARRTRRKFVDRHVLVAEPECDAFGVGTGGNTVSCHPTKGRSRHKHAFIALARQENVQASGCRRSRPPKVETSAGKRKEDWIPVCVEVPQSPDRSYA